MMPCPFCFGRTYCAVCGGTGWSQPQRVAPLPTVTPVPDVPSILVYAVQAGDPLNGLLDNEGNYLMTSDGYNLVWN